VVELDDMARLMAVRRGYRAKAVVLASWRKGTEPRFCALKRACADRRKAWVETTAAAVLGSTR